MSRLATGAKTPAAVSPPVLDPVLLIVIGCLLCGGLVMLTSASISLAERSTGDPFFYLQRQAFAALAGIGFGWMIWRVPTSTWDRVGPMLALLAFVLLGSVLVPGLGHTVNGSTRWLRIAGIAIQVAEPARLLLLMYLAGYAVRHADELRAGLKGFLKPMAVMGLASLLLLAQPEFGSAVVLMAITLAVLLVAGARLRDFLLFSSAVVALGGVAALASPYRMARITGFMDPWADPYNSGFQLIQSLIAIGSGEWMGVGLGSSVQKLFYLPEAHTDFVFAVIAEEFGLLGSLTLVALFTALVWRALCIAMDSVSRGRLYQAYLAFGFAVWQGVQAAINIGVNMGILPTKGLTLPLISYGRSSLIITLVALGLLLRIDYENRVLASRAEKGRGASGRRAAR